VNLVREVNSTPTGVGSLDDALRREVFPSAQPAVLRDFVSHWPAVAAGRRSAADLSAYLRQLDNGSPVDAVMTPPEVEGRIFYDDSMNGFNYVRNRLPLSAVVEQVMRYAGFAKPPAVAVQSALIRDCLPGFLAENRLTVLHESVQPRIWLGNRIKTPTHLDEWNNIGCVVTGRRRFTLFPPGQVGNLYIGPLDFAPTGAPMSLVSLHSPDLARYPKFADALQAAQVAELVPGDAIFIPALWWHHVESLEPLNVLVNYWWHAAAGTGARGGAAPVSGASAGAVGDSPAVGGWPAVGANSGFDALIHAILNLGSLPAATREAWLALFEYYVFGEKGSVTEHIPEHRRGLLGDLSPAEAERIRGYLQGKLKPPK
jgi:hypothetical protein